MSCSFLVIIMFIEMKKQRLNFKFGKAEMWLRYDIQAFCNIEDAGFSPFDVISQSDNPKAIRCFLSNGLADWYNSIDDNNSLDDYVNGVMSAEGAQAEIITYIHAAVLLALPKSYISKKKKKNNAPKADILCLMTMFVDVMGAPLSEFLSSTLREATGRWERYAIAMGYQAPAEKFSSFEDDDDDE